MLYIYIYNIIIYITLYKKTKCYVFKKIKNTLLSVFSQSCWQGQNIQRCCLYLLLLIPYTDCTVYTSTTWHLNNTNKKIQQWQCYNVFYWAAWNRLTVLQYNTMFNNICNDIYIHLLSIRTVAQGNGPDQKWLWSDSDYHETWGCFC